LTKALSREMDLPIRKAEEVVDMVFDTMSKSLISGDRIEVRGFGSFTARHYEGYTGRNPKTGEKTVVAPKKLPFFKPGQDLREKLNQA
ncbi:MAG: HU family DNA-binding protein, partial [Desulfomonilaceae bacterium]